MVLICQMFLRNGLHPCKVRNAKGDGKPCPKLSHRCPTMLNCRFWASAKCGKAKLEVNNKDCIKTPFLQAAIVAQYASMT